MKKYKIKTLGDILRAVNEKNIDGFLKDFEGWLRTAQAAKSMENDMLRLDLDGMEFTWNDDGEYGVVKKITVTIKQLSPQSKGE